MEEAIEAAIDVAGQENLDVRLHEMRYAMPPLKVAAQRPMRCTVIMIPMLAADARYLLGACYPSPERQHALTGSCFVP